MDKIYDCMHIFTVSKLAAQIHSHHPFKIYTTSEWVSEWVDSYSMSPIRLYSAIHDGSRWKIQDRRQIKNTENTETKHNPEKSKQCITQQNKTTRVQLPFMTLGQEMRFSRVHKEQNILKNSYDFDDDGVCHRVDGWGTLEWASMWSLVWRDEHWRPVLTAVSERWQWCRDWYRSCHPPCLLVLLSSLFPVDGQTDYWLWVALTDFTVNGSWAWQSAARTGEVVRVIEGRTVNQ